MKPIHPRHLALSLLATAVGGTAAGQTPINDSLIAPRPGVASAGGELAAAFARARAAVVHVYVEVAGATKFKIERPSSGVVLAGGYVVTRDALIREAVGAADKSVWVARPGAGETPRRVSIVGRDAATGLALLKIDDGGAEPWPGMPLAALPAPGDPVAVLGFHDGAELAGFAGVATAAAAGIELGGADSRRFARDDLLLTDAAIQGRSDGAPMVDREGRLVGLCSAEAVLEDKREPTLEDLKRPSFGFAIPSRVIVSAFRQQLADHAMQPAVASPGSQAVALAAAAVVTVTVGTPPAIGPTDPHALRRRPGAGSGIVIDSSGLVLTNAHLLTNAKGVRVTADSGESWPAEVVSTDTGTNSTVLKVKLPDGRRLPAVARLAEVAARVGDPLFAIGRPEPGSLAVGAGVLSAIRGSALQTDAPMGNQNGGGALVNLRGELVAMLDAGALDRIDVAFAMRGNSAKLDTGLNLTPAITALWAAHDEVLQGGADKSGVAAAPPGPPAPIAELVERIGGSMLNVYIQYTTAAAETEDNPFATPTARTETQSLGSGVIVDPSGLALTNWHVVDDATDPDGSARADHVVRVGTRDGRIYPATVLSISREDDLALIKLELEPGERAIAVELAASAELRIGDGAVAIGNPHGRANTVTAGVVSALDQAIQVKGRWAKLTHLIETDASINGGNSGGALLDIEGRLIGINSAGGSLSAVTGYAISVDRVRQQLEDVLLTPEKLRSPYLGIQVDDRDGAVVTTAVDPFGPGALAGVQVGDRMISIGGVAVRWGVGWAMTVLELEPRDPVTVEYERDGVRARAEVTPMSAAGWAVLRQTGLDVGGLTVAEDAETVRAAAIAMYRAVSGNPTAAPSLLPSSLIRVERVAPRSPDDGIDVLVGDLLLGVTIEQAQASGDVSTTIRFERVEDLQNCVNDHSTYEGVTFKTWIYRDGKVRMVDLVAKRLML